MAWLKSLPAGIAVGVAAGYVAREAVPAIGNAVRPVARMGLKSALVGFEKVREAFAHLGESFEDMTSEVRSELSSSPRPSAAGEGETQEAKTTKEPRKAAG